MKLPRLLRLSVVVGLAACSGGPSDLMLRTAPPTIQVRASSLDSGGALRVIAVASNPTNVHLKVAVPAECPLGITLVPDPKGAGVIGPGTTTGCAYNPGTTDLAPGDSMIITRVVPGRDLLPYASPGMYAVNVTIVSGNATVTVWGGDIQLPLSSSATLPPGNGPLTGTWIQPSIDTWTQLDLSQSGTTLVGYMRRGSSNFGGTLGYQYPIAASVALPRITLEWNDGTAVIMNATLSANGDTLIGTWSVGGGSPTRFFPSFYRRR